MIELAALVAVTIMVRVHAEALVSWCRSEHVFSIGD